jgi:putative protease
MSETLSAMELMAPAGDRESLYAAVSAGADAVYLGGKQFNARRSASNFDSEQLKEAADLLHLHNMKIYVTVNTLINDDELDGALTYLAELSNIGVDAVIIQDLGLIRLTRKYIPDLNLHASTQMTVHNSDGARLLKELGLKRVVLARELTKEDVAEISHKAGIETEVFVHGALCVSYSGQCLMSSMIGGRSGNRGRCAQPCRMEYQLLQNGAVVPTGGSYLLSPKDLALATMIPELDRAGVAALKIEGRMKRPEYVYSVVRTYRKLLDRYLENPSGFRIDPEETRKMEESFNRGFSTGYFGNNRNAAVMSFARPNNRGIFVGRVAEYDPQSRKVRLRLESDLDLGDGVEIWISRGGRGAGTIKELDLSGEPVKSAQTGSVVEFGFGGKAFPGDRVFKVFSAQLHQQTRRAIDPDNPALKVPCDAEVHGMESQPLEVVYRDKAGNEGSARTVSLLEVARKKPLDEEALREHLGRLGNTAYYLDKLEINLPPGLMMPFSALNQVRREAIEKLHQHKMAQFPRRPVRLKDLEAELPMKGNRLHTLDQKTPILSVWVGDLGGVSAAVNAGAAIVYAGGDELTGFRWTEGRLRDAVKIAHAHGAKLVMGMPRINSESQRDLWNFYYDLIIDLSEDGIIVSDLGLLNLAFRSKRPLYLNYTLNFFNSSSFPLFQNPLIEQITVSPELTLKQISELNRPINNIRLEGLVQGPLELMVSEYCPMNASGVNSGRCQQICKSERFFLRDRLELDFPIYTDQFCRMHLLNSKDHCLYEDLPKVAQSGLSVLRLDLKTSSATEVGLFTRKYHKALEQIAAGEPPGDGEEVIAVFKRVTGRGITKGHYFRGVE